MLSQAQGITAAMPVLALRGLVIFPKTLASFDIGRKKSANALKYAMDNDRLVYVVTQKDAFVDDPIDSDLYSIGCVVKVKGNTVVGVFNETEITFTFDDQNRLVTQKVF